MLKSGHGCPACKGEPVYDCELANHGEPLPDGYTCPYFSSTGHQCSNKEHCDHQVRRQPEQMKALRSWLNASDEDPIAIINRMVGL